MIHSYPIIYQGGIGEIIEKKSKFIAQVFPIENEEEALGYLETLRKKYYDATHNCFAYVLGDKHNIQRCSDDGEPSGTAGRPILDVLLGEDIHNALIVVTRYFGGTLLGTGGLVRAYSEAAKEGLNQSIILQRQSGKKLLVRTDYTGLGKLQYLAAQNDISVLDTRYTDIVELSWMVPSSQVEVLIKQVTEATSGQAIIQMEEEVFFGNLNGNVVFLK